MGKKCDHSMGGTWQAWQYSQGPRSGIQWRIKTCNGCGKTIDSQSKSV